MSVRNFITTMPTINKKTNAKNHQSTERKKQRQTMYNKTEWQKLRKAFLQQHPLCQTCLADGKTTLAQHVHHKISYLNGSNEAKQIELLLSYENLQALCIQCHTKLHNYKMYNTKNK